MLGYHAAVALDVSIGGMMAVTTGGFLAAAFLFGPRYGRAGPGLAAPRPALASTTAGCSRSISSSTRRAPRATTRTSSGRCSEHLRWSERKAEQVVARSLRQGLVLRDGVRLYLTAKGRQLALELLEPWRAGA